MKFILMGRNNYFRFKQFTIIQEKSAMKVGIDGVLLGAWATAPNPQKILDVGTGTGLIALMMAQRFPVAGIDAVEIDTIASKEAQFNFDQSSWAERIQLFNISFQQFAVISNNKYDLIVSNPPFFENSVNLKTTSREFARNSENMSLNELFNGVSKVLLSDEGHFSLIFPHQRLDELIRVATGNGMFPARILRIKPNPQKIYHRVLAEFSRLVKIPDEDELIIESVTHHDYSEKYCMLTRDFYLHFK